MVESVVGVHEAKTHLSRLLERAEAGEVIAISRRGRVVARLVPAEPHRPRLGTMAGRIRIAPDFDDPLPPDVAAAFGA